MGVLRGKIEYKFPTDHPAGVRIFLVHGSISIRRPLVKKLPRLMLVIVERRGKRFTLLHLPYCLFLLILFYRILEYVYLLVYFAEV